MAAVCHESMAAASGFQDVRNCHAPAVWNFARNRRTQLAACAAKFTFLQNPILSSKPDPLMARSFSLLSILVLASFPMLSAKEAPALPQREEVIRVIRQVNDHWQKAHPNHGDAFWNRAVYHIGNMDAHAVTGESAYRKFSEKWSEKNQWKGAKSDKKEEWIYSYGESDKFVLFGDWQACFQVYFALHRLDPQPQKIARATEVMGYQITTAPNDYLWWADGLFMVMPVMTEMHQLTGDPHYLKKLRDYFDYARDLMYDSEAALFFRDAKYVFPKHKSVNGRKDFWARGNGWVFAALPMVIESLPAGHPDRAHYQSIYQAMAKSLAACQHAEGYWTRSLLDGEHAPGPETSGTSFFTRGYLWGLRKGVLDKATYEPVVKKSWAYLTTKALQEDGRLGYIQPIGEKASPGQFVDARSTADFGVGAFLLAAAEMTRYVEGK
ncbi:MAG: glycoside hydrolase family 88 protein [Akkermansiaceae bacterium]|nr:glycoside hydrolase family 88 protein [Akkermansiaceae bacterium]